jgi:hypothetical protein
VDASIGLGIGEREPIELSVVRDRGGADLVIGDCVAEIRLRRPHLETLRDQLPGVLAELDVLDAADERASTAGSRAAQLASSLRDAAIAAAQTDESERAVQMRDNADKLIAAADALDVALEAVEAAARVADHAALDARHLLARPGAEDQSAPDQPPNVG